MNSQDLEALWELIAEELHGMETELLSNSRAGKAQWEAVDSLRRAMNEIGNAMVWQARHEGAVTPKKGDRIRFIAHNPPDPDPLPCGEEGTVILANEMNISVDWDSGRRLSLAPTDHWEPA